MNANFSECDARFRKLLEDFDVGALEHARSTVYGVWPDLTLAYMNPQWFIFAAENGGEPNISREWSLGRSVLDSIAAPIRPFYETNYARCLSERRPWEHNYECPSADVVRRFHHLVMPLGQSEGLLLIHSLLVEEPQPSSGAPAVVDRYLNAAGFRVQCCHCRKFRRTDVPYAWDWVAAWIRRTPDNVSHGICEACLGYYYPPADSDANRNQPFSTLDDADDIDE